MDPIRQLLLIAVVALIVYFIPIEARIKNVCWVFIGIALILVLIGAIFGVHLF